MHVSDEGRAKLIAREGVRLHPYCDSAGVPTIGIGCTFYPDGRRVTLDDQPITRAQADQMFAVLLVRFASGVESALTRQPTQEQFDAMVSLAFNIGIGGFKGSTVVKKFNAGDIQGAADAFLMWNRPPEIIGRRTGERDQFLSGATVKEPLQVAPVVKDSLIPAAPVSPWVTLLRFILSLFKRRS